MQSSILSVLLESTESTKNVPRFRMIGPARNAGKERVEEQGEGGEKVRKRRKGQGERKGDKSDTEQGDRKERFRI